MQKVVVAALRDNLLAPVTSIAEISAFLLEECGDVDQPLFVADLHKIHQAGRKLLELVQEILAPIAAAADSRALDLNAVQTRLRHDALNVLNPVINYCELWLEEADELFVERYVADLRKMHESGRRCQTAIDDVLGAGTRAESLEVADHVRAVVDSIAPQAGNAADLQPGTILVVDDNEYNRDLLFRQLSKQGHTVAVAANGRQCLEMLQQQTFDLILLDVILPEMNGLHVLERLKADTQLRTLPVIMISALDEIDSVVRCIEMGAEDYLTKPFNRVLLLARLRACLEKKRLRDREALYLAQIERERQRADDLLHVILPGAAVHELKATNKVIPRRYENVAVLFGDIVGFTPFCDNNPPEYGVTFLQQLIEEWEAIAARHQVQKIKTIGDAFMAAAGLLEKTEDHPVLHCLRCGLDMIAATQRLPTQWNLRVGIHFGPVVAGVLGHRQYLFDLWGDTVNTAARMESHGVPGAVVLSSAAWQPVACRCRGELLRSITVKGKGAMEMIRFDGFLTAPTR